MQHHVLSPDCETCRNYRCHVCNDLQGGHPFRWGGVQGRSPQVWVRPAAASYHRRVRLKGTTLPRLGTIVPVVYVRAGSSNVSTWHADPILRG